LLTVLLFEASRRLQRTCALQRRTRAPRQQTDVKNNVIDFRSRQPKAEAPAPNRTPQFVVEFFDDPDFPFRFKGVEPTPDFYAQSRARLRERVPWVTGDRALQRWRRFATAAPGGVLVQRWQDGRGLLFNPPAFDGPEAYDWMMRVAPPALLKVLRETKEAQCIQPR
jgi:hypothetical protein